MRAILALAAFAAFTLPTLAQQQPRPSAQPPASRPPAQAQPAPPPAPAAAPPTLFPCRTATEVCHVGVVINNQVSVLFTNSDKADGIESKPIDVVDAAGAKLDLGRYEGQVVMLTGEYDPKTGLTKAELVEAASPLVSFAIKVLLSGDEGEDQEEQAAQPAPPPPAPGRSGAPQQPAPRR
jgi:hypothetical protein